MKILATSILAITFLTTSGHAQSRVLPVWSEKYPTIQSAIDAAGPSDVVLVGDGYFWEDIDFKGKAITVRSENGPDHTAIRGQVTFQSAEGRASVLTGFSIWPAARATEQIGIEIIHASPTIEGNRIGRPWPEPTHAAAILCHGGQPLITANTIADNEHNPSSGGPGVMLASGIRLYGSNALVLFNVLARNSAQGRNEIKVWIPGRGGAVYCTGGAPVIEGNLIQSNHCHGYGAYGGGIHLNGTNAVVRRNAILDNVASGSGTTAMDSHGGGIYSTGGMPDIQGNIIARNLAGGTVSLNYGGGVHCDSGRIANNTIYGNEATSSWFMGGGGIWGTSATQVWNNIIWQNKGPAVSGVPIASLFHNTIDDSAYQGQNGNINRDPLLANPAANDFHLQPGSPCIDAGSLTVGPLPAEDIDFEPRVIDGLADTIGAPDTGADEFATLRKPPELVVRPGSNVPLSLRVQPSARQIYLLACALGTGAGIPLPPPSTRRIPLDPDWLFWLSLGQNNGVFTQFVGALDSQGHANASLAIPPRPELTGVTVHVGGITFLPDRRIVILNPLHIEVT